MMKDYGEEYNPCCYLHPKEVVVGICALCLKERLLNLASNSKQGHLHLPKDSNKFFRVLRRKPTITLPKVFASGSLFLHRLQSRRQRPEDKSDEGSFASLEESFITIKLEDDGQASWKSKKKASVETWRKESKGGGGRSTVTEHGKQQGMLRWRKRIGQLLQLARWKRSSKATASHVGLVG